MLASNASDGKGSPMCDVLEKKDTFAFSRSLSNQRHSAHDIFSTNSESQARDVADLFPDKQGPPAHFRPRLGSKDDGVQRDLRPNSVGGECGKRKCLLRRSDARVCLSEKRIEDIQLVDLDAEDESEIFRSHAPTHRPLRTSSRYRGALTRTSSEPRQLKASSDNDWPVFDPKPFGSRSGNYFAGYEDTCTWSDVTLTPSNDSLVERKRISDLFAAGNPCVLDSDILKNLCPDQPNVRNGSCRRSSPSVASLWNKMRNKVAGVQWAIKDKIGTMQESHRERMRRIRSSGSKILKTMKGRDTFYAERRSKPNPVTAYSTSESGCVNTTSNKKNLTASNVKTEDRPTVCECDQVRAKDIEK